MNLVKNIFYIIVVAMTIISHQACIDEIDLNLNTDSDAYVIEARLVYPNTTHYVDIRMLSGETTPFHPNDISVELIDDNGKMASFVDVTKIPLDTIDRYYPVKLDSIYNEVSQEYYYSWVAADEAKDKVRWDLLARQNGNYTYMKTYAAINSYLEVGRVYTLRVLIDGKEYCATEKLMPPIEITNLQYLPIEREKSIWQDSYTLLCPTFSLVNKAENHSKYFMAVRNHDCARIFHTENMCDTLRELQLNEYLHEPTYEIGSIPFSNNDSWFIDAEDRIFSRYNTTTETYYFYPISKNNYDFYKAIEKQIRTDGGLYSPCAATPVSNFTGDNIYGQFIITSESKISSNEASNYNELIY